MKAEVKLVGGTMMPAQVVAEVAQIIQRTCGFKASKVSRMTRLVEDAGIAGDDGDALLTALDDAFEMDWTGIDSGVIFGNEGFGPPPLWLLRNNCILFEPQTLTVGELVDNLGKGRWVLPTPMVPVRGWRRCWIYVASGFMTIVWGILPVLLGIGLIGWFLGR